MKKQFGFTLVEGLLIVLIVSFIGFAGYYVWNSQKDSDETTDQSSSQSESEQDTEDEVATEVDISEDWKRFTSGNKGFSVKLVNGMTGLSDTTSDFIIVNTYSESDSPADITEVEGYGSDGHSVLTVYQMKDSQSFSMTEKLEFKEVSFTTSSGVTGVKQTFKTPYSPPCEGPGCYVGTEYTNYEFEDDSTGLTTYVVYARRILNPETAKIYDMKADDPDLSAEIDAIVKSLEIK